MPEPLPVTGQPYFVAVPQPATSAQRLGRWFARTLLILSLLLNVYLFFLLGLYSSGETVSHVHVRGERFARDKIAIVRVDGLIAEGFTRQTLRELEEAGRDESVKAVILAINSPGGTITASDELHHHILKLQAGGLPRQTSAKPVIVSMGSIAASGGYYIAAPAERIFAQPTTLTASIGVYAALPNFSELAEKLGIQVNLIKRGELKAGGSPFKKLEPDVVIPMHCSGDNFVREVGRQMPNQLLVSTTGSRFTFGA